MNLVFGASGFAREVDWLSHDINVAGSGDFTVDCFVVEDSSDLVGTSINSKPVLSESEAFCRFAAAKVNCFIAVGVPSVKKIIASNIRANLALASFPNLIHPTVSCDSREGQVTIGEGVILYPGVVVSCNTTLGDFVTVNVNAVVGHDVTVGDYCQLSPGACLGGWSALREGVTVGTNASILPRATVEAWAVVGAGSVVLRRVPPGLTVFGVPAKPLPLPVRPK